MEGISKINKVRLLEMDFPAGIPADFYTNLPGSPGYIVSNCGEKPIEVVNESGETIGLFYDISLMLKIPRGNSQQFTKEYDKIVQVLDSYFVLGCLQDPDFYEHDENGIIPMFDIQEQDLTRWASIDLAMSACCRLRYPYKLGEENKNSYKNFLLEYFPSGDFWIRLLYDVVWGTTDEDKKSTIPILINLVGELNIPELSHKMIEGMIEADNNLIYDYFSISLTKDNIDYWIEIANSTGKTVLLAFLLDYKNKHFPADSETA